MNAQITQQNDADDSVRLVQDSDRSVAVVNQSWCARRRVDIEQVDAGYGRVELDQQGNGLGVTAYVTGDAPSISVNQSGFQHTAKLIQDTAGNVINLTQSGFSNHAVITQ